MSDKRKQVQRTLTRAFTLALRSNLLKHREPQSCNAELLLLVIPLGIVAKRFYAFSYPGRLRYPRAVSITYALKKRRPNLVPSAFSLAQARKKDPGKEVGEALQTKMTAGILRYAATDAEFVIKPD